MKDEKKTKEQLIKELEALRQQIAELKTLEPERKQREKEQAAFLRLSQAFLATLDPQTVMEQTVETIGQMLGEEHILIFLPDEKWEKMVVRCTGGWTRDLLGLEVSLRKWQESGVAYVLRPQEPVLIEDTATDSRLRPHPAAMAEGMRSRVVVPMLAEGKSLGTLVVSSPKSSRFTAAHVHLLSLIANQTAVAMERAQLYHKLQASSAELEQKVEERTRELREAQEELMRKEKLATLGQLASSVAHELRQPLSVMTNALYYLHMQPQETNSDIKEYLGILQTEVNVAEKIVEDLLDFARIRPPQRQAVAVRELVMDQMARLSLPSTVTVQQDFPSELPLVYVDRVQIGQVVSNLLRNALEAMEKQGGTLTLAGAQVRKDQVLLSVIDTGEGIPEENLKKIFEPLFTTKAQGIGLGLSVSQKLAQANGGDLWVQSRVGEGTIFILVLPIAGREPQGTP